MIAALWDWCLAYPVLASVLFLILLLMVLLFAISVTALRQLPPDTLSELSERQALEPEHQQRQSISRPLPWTRSGGNWWPVP